MNISPVKQKFQIEAQNKFQNKFQKSKNTNACTNQFNTSNLISYPNNYYINDLSFLGHYKASDLIKRIGEENFPSPNIVERLRSYGNSKDYSLYDIHLDYYKDLLECKTLDEAKEKYPEFKDVIDARDINIDSLDKRSVLYKISQGKIEGASLDTLSLDILKKYYGKLISVINKEEYWGMGPNTVIKTANLLNIKIMNKKYAITAAHQSEESKAKSKEQWQDPEYRKMQSEKKRKQNEQLWQDPKFIKMQSERMRKQVEQQWQDPEFRKMMSERMQEQWQDPEYRKMQSEKAEQRWQDPEYIKKMDIRDKARSEAYVRHPEIREVMQEVAKDFPRLAIIRSKRQDKLTDEEITYKARYFRACEERIPGYSKIIGEEQYKILQEWGFYDE